MFWKFNLISTSHIETILNKENVSLTELMDEDDILQECKAQNKALVDFLTKPEIMEEMVNLIVNEPAEELEEKIRFKYSNLAAELLTADVPQINDSLAADPALITKLYSFLEPEKSLNPLLSSFFSKVMGILISRKTDYIFEFLKTKDDFIKLLITHLRTSAIMDLLLRLITCPENPKTRLDILNWLNEQCVVEQLIGLIDPSVDEERHCNASQALCDTLRLAREQVSQMGEKPDADPILQSLESTEMTSKLIEHMFNGEKNESALVNGILVLLTLLEVKKPGLASQLQPNEQTSSLYFRPETQETLTPQEAERVQQSVQRTVTAVLPYLKNFHQLLLEPPQKGPLLTTFGTISVPLGNTRIHVARLVSALLATNTSSINNELVRLGTIEVLLDLFFQYSWNNFLHTQVEQSIGLILYNCPGESGGGDDSSSEHAILSHLFNVCNIVQRILNAWEENDQEGTKPGSCRRGYMGHLTKIANHVFVNMDKGTNSERIKQAVKALPDDVQKKWEEFVTATLTEVNKKNQIPMVGGPALQSSSEDDDGDLREMHISQDPALEQAFSDYQMQQMTSPFIDQFGYNEDEFGDNEESLNSPLERLTAVSFNISAPENERSAALFEQACNERIQSFDDTDSDEDIWDDKEQEVGFPYTSNISTCSISTRLQTTLSSMSPSSTTAVTRSSDVAPSSLPVKTSSPPVSPTSSESSPSSEEEKEENEEQVVATSEEFEARIPPVVSSDGEAKMEVDDGENGTQAWATFDASATNVTSVAMDTGNPWESPPISVSSTVVTSSSTQAAPETTWCTAFEPSTQTRKNPGPEWADFSAFDSTFVSSVSDPTENPATAMETGEESQSNVTVSSTEDAVTPFPSSAAVVSSSVDDRVGDSNHVSSVAAPAECVTSSSEVESKPSDVPMVVDSECKNFPPSDSTHEEPSNSSVVRKTEEAEPDQSPDEAENLADNFNFLSSAGLLRSPATTSGSGERPSAENGPVLPNTEPMNDVAAELGSGDAPSCNSEPQPHGKSCICPLEECADQQARIDEARLKAQEALDKLNAVMTTPPNGPF